MYMKNRYIITILWVFSNVMHAQNQHSVEGDKLFHRFEYVDAAKAYLKLVDKGKADVYVYKQLGECYYAIFNTKEAIVWFSKAVEKPQEPEIYYKYAQMLKAEGNWIEYTNQMQIFSKLEPNDSRSKVFLDNPNSINQLKQQKPHFEVKKLELNTDKADFGAFLSQNDELYFVSARNTDRKLNGMDGQPYLDVYKSMKRNDGTYEQPVAVDELNSKWHEGPVTITSDEKTLYFSSESFTAHAFDKQADKHLKRGQIYLFKATKSEKGTWQNIVPLPFNNKSYSYRNPSVSKDGKMLFFSSNMPGGFGGEDIWSVRIEGDSYGKPENLGALVNTEGNESFPFVSQDGVLYFSSNGKAGFGGYDVFSFKNDTKEVQNLGLAVNTEKDDFAFTYDQDKKVGFLASNRDGNDDLFQVNPICNLVATVRVIDAETGKILPYASIQVIGNGVDQQEKVSNESGEAKFDLVCQLSFEGQVIRNGYEKGTFIIEITNDNSVMVEVKLVPIKPIITSNEVLLQSIFFEYDKSNITREGAEELNKLVQIMKEHPEMVVLVKSHTDSQGDEDYNLKLSQRRAQATVQYVISKGIAVERISAMGVGESELKVLCDVCSEEDNAANRRSEFLILKK